MQSHKESGTMQCTKSSPILQSNRYGKKHLRVLCLQIALNLSRHSKLNAMMCIACTFVTNELFLNGKRNKLHFENSELK